MKILLVGYYGFGNLGDDILLKVTFCIVKEKFKNSEIFVLSHARNSDYIVNLLGETVCVVRPGERAHYDLIVHGGGGTFHDYGSYSLQDSFINWSIKAMGPKAYVALDKALRSLTGKKRVSGDRRVGLGIGVGTYTSDSRRLRHAIPILIDFDQLMVRDTQSLENFRRLGIDAPVALGSDLAFLEAHWAPTPQKTKSEKARLGIVVRDWPANCSTNYILYLREVLPSLRAKFEVSIFVFCKHEDSFASSLEWEDKIHVWDPARTSLHEYCRTFGSQDLVVTARAHGALCAAIMGIPSLIIEVEPKLATIHSIIPNSSQIMSADRTSINEIEKFLDFTSNINLKHIDEDCQKNRFLAKNSLEKL